MMKETTKTTAPRTFKAALSVLFALCLLGAAAMVPAGAQAKSTSPGRVTGLYSYCVDCPCHTHLDWKKVKGADKYQIAYKWRAKDAWKYKTVKSTDYGLNVNLNKYKKKSDNPKLQFKVRAVKGSKKGAWSKTATGRDKPYWCGSKTGWC